MHYASKSCWATSMLLRHKFVLLKTNISKKFTFYVICFKMKEKMTFS